MNEASKPFHNSQRYIEDWYMFDNETTENQSTTPFEYIITTQTSWIEGEDGVIFLRHATVRSIVAPKHF